ncbi:NAD-glutamate dehydrogenase [Reinekea marina]|uniref:NAD-glutamate dehydrogenase n=1 Tax=Reinekea marina TaxID=1310421 RepID=A0ABV7WU06_9GAMM|nr:NAD-glutamate dehydrogenase [Reinekea marina]MDN3649654.1 NAD-glutamate dehydrogenase [Reinekea marina]
MTNLVASNRSELLESLYQRLTTEFPKQHHSDLNTLIEQLFKHASMRDLTSYEMTDLAGMVVTLWRALQKKSPKQANVEVINPSVEEHEWQSSHSIVTVLSDEVPFVIDSARLALNSLDINIHAIFYGSFFVERDNKGKFVKFSDKGSNELLLCLEMDRTTVPEQRKQVEDSLNEVLLDVHYVVDDFPAMLEKTKVVKEAFKKENYPFSKDEMEEASVFMQWMADNHFSFLAYDEYEIFGDVVKQVEGTALGLFKKTSKRREEVISDMTEYRKEHVFKQELMIFSKSGRRSSVHRPAYSDYVLVKKFDKKGNVIGGYRFLGLYTSSVYSETAKDIPVVRTKIAEIIKGSGYAPGSHAYKEFAAILYTLPRDELIQGSVDELHNVTNEILSIQERKQIRLFLRKDAYGKFLNAMVYMPRDIFNTQLRIKVHDLLASHFEVEGSDFTSYFSESVLARTRIVFKLAKPIEEMPDIQRLENKIVQLARRWTDELQQAMVESFGEEKGIRLYQQYEHAFPSSYVEEYSARVAVADIQRIESLQKHKTDKLALSFFRSIEPTGSALKLKIFNKGDELQLSDLIPVLENLGLKVVDEFPYEIMHPKNGCTWIYDFNLVYEADPELDPAEYRDLFSKAFLNIWNGRSENDLYNRLVLRAKLTWREVAMLRGYAKYMKQTQFSLSQEYIAETLIQHTQLTDHITELFSARFNPEKQGGKNNCESWVDKINALLEDVNNINEDKILRRYVELIMATLRTNFYQEDDQGLRKEYISFKLDPSEISDIPLPRPKYEIFVYSPRLEGVHLRGGNVARGGLRWSDRNEDFRTEVLGLVKAQQVKNAVIVPVGAKGGFVAKQLPPASDREAFFAEGIACYKTFIRGLLDLTDNLVEADVVPPKQVVRYDNDDPYMVVAADKGTATFSDIANEVADEYGFWLGDAFASGGSYGYDHKGMGITARGAWVSVQRHFRELGIDVQTESISVVGIGDMAGDVFGNGLLRSKMLKMVGAFNHMHIFVDPNPNTEESFKERERLFELPRSTWEDYNKDLISKGGGIFSRSSKSIAISKEMKAVFGISASKLSPNELITAMLKAPVDLIWNGGIGTYVKSTDETHADVGDKANDPVRVNGCELQARVLGEGGNLGFSQLGRIEFNLNGGRCFTDFIDNAGGVDCSDHEVNMKILLDDMVAAGDMTVKQRNETLQSLTDDVSNLVLRNNYRQTQALGVAITESLSRIEEYRRLINGFESEGKLNRELEFLPSDETISERKANGQSLTRPELAILISYVKGDLKEQLANQNLAEDDYVARAVETEFPAAMVKRFGAAIHQHRLKKEIVATQVANDMINYMGITYYNRLQESTGASAVEAAKAYIAARDIFGLHQLFDDIEALDHKVPSDLQSDMMRRTLRMVRRASRWLIKNYRMGINMEQVVKQYKAPLQELAGKLDSLLPKEANEAWVADAKRMEEAGVSHELAMKIASSDILYTALGVVGISQSIERDALEVAQGYFMVGDALGLEQFARQVNELKVFSHWQAMARESFRDDLEWQQRRITQGLFFQMGKEGKLVETVDKWLVDNHLLVERWLKMMSEIRAVGEPEFSMYSVAIRELLDLSQATLPEL